MATIWQELSDVDDTLTKSNLPAFFEDYNRKCVIAKLPLHSQRVVLARFKEAYVAPALSNIEIAQGTVGVSAAVLDKFYEEYQSTMDEEWTQGLTDFAVRALIQDIDNLLLEYAPLVLAEEDHPLTTLLGGPPPSVRDD